jgi:hypothetical protein
VILESWVSRFLLVDCMFPFLPRFFRVHTESRSDFARCTGIYDCDVWKTRIAILYRMLSSATKLPYWILIANDAGIWFYCLAKPSMSLCTATGSLDRCMVTSFDCVLSGIRLLEVVGFIEFAWELHSFPYPATCSLRVCASLSQKSKARCHNDAVIQSQFS